VIVVIVVIVRRDAPGVHRAAAAQTF